jgi:hypothetical protein
MFRWLKHYLFIIFLFYYIKPVEIIQISDPIALDRNPQ